MKINNTETAAMIVAPGVYQRNPKSVVIINTANEIIGNIKKTPLKTYSPPFD